MPFRALSWGCGIQSTTLAVMSAVGDLPRLDAIITADTHWERQATYDAREFYTAWLQEHGLEVHVVEYGSVKELGAAAHIHIPFWTESGGPLRRQCTLHFKIRPIKRKIRELIGFHPSKAPNPPAGAVEAWMGISLDEYTRMKDSGVEYITNRFPLIERRITRQDCIQYLQDKELPVPIKSACIGCPYRLASEWLEMREEAPAEFAEAVAFDEAHRDNPMAERDGSTADRLYIYKAKRTKPMPLSAADLVEHV